MTSITKDAIAAAGHSIEMHEMPDGDQFGVLLHESHYIDSGLALDEQFAQVRKLCEGLAAAALTAALPVVAGAHVLVPKTPSRGMLISMALREDHSFCAPVQEIGGITLGLSQAERESRLRTMARIYEEIVGAGFYREDREDFYLSMIGDPPPGAGER